MDTYTLVTELKEDGRKLVEELLQRGFDVSAAFWLKASEKEEWNFYIVSPMVESQGLREAYMTLHPLVRAMPQPFWIELPDITLIGPSNPIAQDVLAIQKRKAGTRLTPANWQGRRLGNVSIDAAYLYLLPVGTP
ncbi:MAG TPA: hypothetical protein VH682_00965 [Gemmataceae bacterium]|jgi:hypothetical protein